MCSHVRVVDVLSHTHVHTGFFSSFWPNTFLSWEHTYVVSREHGPVRKAGGGEAQAANKPKEALAPSWKKQKDAAGADVEMPGAEQRSRV